MRSTRDVELADPRTREHSLCGPTSSRLLRDLLPVGLQLEAATNKQTPGFGTPGEVLSKAADAWPTSVGSRPNSASGAVRALHGLRGASKRSGKVGDVSLQKLTRSSPSLLSRPCSAAMKRRGDGSCPGSRPQHHAESRRCKSPVMNTSHLREPSYMHDTTSSRIHRDMHLASFYTQVEDAYRSCLSHGLNAPTTVTKEKRTCSRSKRVGKKKHSHSMLGDSLVALACEDAASMAAQCEAHVNSSTVNGSFVTHARDESPESIAIAEEVCDVRTGTWTNESAASSVPADEVLKEMDCIDTCTEEVGDIRARILKTHSSAWSTSAVGFSEDIECIDGGSHQLSSCTEEKCKYSTARAWEDTAIEEDLASKRGMEQPPSPTCTRSQAVVADKVASIDREDTAIQPQFAAQASCTISRSDDILKPSFEEPGLESHIADLHSTLKTCSEKSVLNAHKVSSDRLSRDPEVAHLETHGTMKSGPTSKSKLLQHRLSQRKSRQQMAMPLETITQGSLLQMVLRSNSKLGRRYASFLTMKLSPLPEPLNAKPPTSSRTFLPPPPIAEGATSATFLQASRIQELSHKASCDTAPSQQSLFQSWHTKSQSSTASTANLSAGELHAVAVATVAASRAASSSHAFSAKPSIGTWLMRPVAGPTQGQKKAEMEMTLSAFSQTDRQTPSKNFALHFAARDGNLAAVRMLLAARMDPCLSDECGIVPLHLAADAGFEEIVGLLLDSRASPHAVTIGKKAAMRGITALHAASSNGSATVVIRLLAARAPPQPARGDGVVPLHFAAQHGHTSVALALLAIGASPDCRGVGGFTPLHDAAYEGHTSMLAALLASRSDVHIADDAGTTPLHSSAQRGHVDATKYLLSHGASPCKSSLGGFTPLHDAAHAGHLCTVRLLLEAAASASARSKDGGTPLHLAAQAGWIEIVQELIYFQSDSSMALDGGIATPLRLAASRGHMSVVRALRKRSRV